jgi:TetR/AcrR family transcriptional repressor of nem operon
LARYSTEHKEQTRARIVDLAAQRIREDGLAGLGVAGIMAEAGLTHGGFYAHFPSRDALLAEAVSRLFGQACETVDRMEGKHGANALSRYVDFYLSPRHRDDRTIGCPIPALAGEVRNSAPEVRQAFDAGLDTLADTLGRITPQGGRPAGRKAALALLGEMAGKLAVARSMSDERRSSAMLADARAAAMGAG